MVRDTIARFMYTSQFLAKRHTVSIRICQTRKCTMNIGIPKPLLEMLVRSSGNIGNQFSPRTEHQLGNNIIMIIGAISTGLND